MRPDALAESAPVHGIRVFAVEGGDRHCRRRQHLTIDEFLDARDVASLPRHVRERDQGVRLAAAVLRVQAEDRRCLAAPPRDAKADAAQQLAQTLGWMRVGEERRRILILAGRLAIQNLRKVSGELGVLDGAKTDVVARFAEVEDRLHACAISL